MKMTNSAIIPIRKPPKGGETVNHRLLVQGGFVRQLMAGVYIYLPLGLRVLDKIRQVIRAEMNTIGGQEILMPLLHPAKNWKTTGGWDNIDVLFKLKSRTGKDFALGQSHEEIVTPLAKELIRSYRDLPLALYQIHWKFRDELRSKSGLLRGREFEMKDLYSFHASQRDFEKFYKEVKNAYLKAFKKVELEAKVTEASGGGFSEKISYEFMVTTDAGEDDILYCDACEFCINLEIAKVKAGSTCPKCTQGKLNKAKAAEVGNIFDLGQKYVKDFGLEYRDEQGKAHYPIMGCYGWGTTRTMAVLVEKFHDDKGIIWPKSVSPYHVHLIDINQGQQGELIYNRLQNENIEVLWDDRSKAAGVKFADADLIGIPVRLIVSEKTKTNVEWKRRMETTSEIIDISSSIDRIKQLYNQL
ncbi:hypothetical protein A3A66_02625 [Microgenomates group bacterium RIFCSPLOWO2_01_FULL_46_13]|nr:MAG: hypothetical protein A2783_03120 [Microgenomates group bacterium RIFCSPHIGHO2_01_FULL_45_11]OGV94865.1 MAG: hypothetical protein A3A66_02625 [Microgenomates group bacterium RIFCSPLOWO2_01_FULL_46_13]